MDIIKEIKENINESINTKQKILNNCIIINNIIKAINIIEKCYQNNGKVILCGNGGSASDALHLEGELMGRFKKERKGLAALTLNSNQATITAIGNDFSYDKIFERQIECIGQKNDVFIAISTSGNSKNVLNALKIAKEKKINTIALLGHDGGLCKEYSDISIIVDSNNTPRIQESHIMIGHIICELLEKVLEENEKK